VRDAPPLATHPGAAQIALEGNGREMPD